MKPNRIVVYITAVTAFILLACNASIAVRDVVPTLTLPPAQEPTKTEPVVDIIEPVDTSTPIPNQIVPTDVPVAPCYEGKWQLTNLSTAVMATIPQETIDQYNLQFSSESGIALMKLSPDGSAEMDFNQVKIEFSARVSIIRVPLTVSVDGISRGSYQAAEGSLITSGMDTSGISASAQAAGQDLIPPDDLIASLPLVSPYFNTASMSCSGDAMQLKIAGYPETMPALVFKRIQ